ncbi:MAG: aminotransferase class IV [Bdellovibrionota bacterium]
MSSFQEINSLDAIRRDGTDMLVMYNSWAGGLIRNPALMLVPIDDHLVHRGDGVFEAIKVIKDKPWLKDKHLKRLKGSAAYIGLDLSKLPQLEAVVDTLSKEHQDLGTRLLRIFVARGPGSFSTNPYDSTGPQLYVILHKMKPPADRNWNTGVKTGISDFTPKGFPWATIKSCNYLINVMMKKEAVDKGLDFTLGFDGDTLTESSTENLAVLTQADEIIYPPKKTILSGTTLERMCELVREHEPSLKIIERKLTLQELQQAKEVFMVGTTIDVMPVVEVAGKPIGQGVPGPWARKLKLLLEADQQS